MNKKFLQVNLQIIILLTSLFAFPFIIYEAENAEAAASVSSVPQTACCSLDKNGAKCQDMLASNCADSCSASCSPATCDKTIDCKLGCCFNNNDGTCSANSPKAECERENGIWSDNAACNIPKCQKGCCILGNNAEFITQTSCNKISGNLGLIADFKQDIQNELSCLALSNSKEEGACLLGVRNELGNLENSCKFTYKEDCLKLKGSFHKDYLCTSLELNTSCKMTKETRCLENKDGVYFLDSCGNTANIYDASKINDKSYWEKRIQINESCGAGDSNGNMNSPECGNCNYLIGSRCASYKSGSDPGNAKPRIGDNFCKSLDCPKTSEGYKKNGESWCIYDGWIGDGKDTVGSRHWKHYCINGEEKVEPCAEYRQEICVQSEVKNPNTNEKFSSASCRINNWRACIEASNDVASNPKKAQKNCQENPDCSWKHFKFTKDWETDLCLPKYPSGLDLKSTSSSQLCDMASQTCKVIYVKDIDGWDCKANCECEKASWTQKMNEWCSSLGDCGAKVNIAGKVTTDGYNINSKGKLLTQVYLDSLKKYANYKKGQEASPGNTSKILKALGITGSPDSGDAEQIVSADVAQGTALINSAGKISGALGISALVVGTGVGLVAGGLAGAKYVFTLFTAGAETALGIYPAGMAPGVSSFMSSVAPFMNALGAVAGGILAGMMVSSWFGLPLGATIVTTVVATAMAVYVYTQGQSFMLCATLGPLCATGWGFIAAVIIAAIFKLIGIGKTKEIKVTFQCMAYQPPAGGSDCEKCNKAPIGGDYKLCSKYRCESLGKSCELINENTGQDKCIDNNPNDADSPKIEPLYSVISEGYKYSNITGNSFRITDLQGGCVKEFSPITFGIETNEYAQCKMDTQHTANYDSMQYTFFEGSLLLKNHTTFLSLPSASSLLNITRSGIVLNQAGEFNLYIRCRDTRGNANNAEYNIKACVKAGPDLTAPYVRGASPSSGSYIKANTTSKNVTFFINEPSECKWSSQNKKYNDMENTMQCENELDSGGIYGWPCSATLMNITSNSKYYVLCKDQPWFKDMNESLRNVKTNPDEYSLIVSSQLKVTSIFPENKAIITEGIEPITVNLKVNLQGGSGDSVCSYSSDNVDFSRFFSNSGSYSEQVFNQMVRGNYKFYINCEDSAGNTIANSTEFKLQLDTNPPIITRAYNSGGLKITTNEDAICTYSNKNCNFKLENGTSMGGLGKQHSADWNVNFAYYIKCKDAFGNIGGGCSKIIEAYTMK